MLFSSGSGTCLHAHLLLIQQAAASFQGRWDQDDDY